MILGRTYPTHPYFKQVLGSGQLSLFSLLKAYSVIDEEVGYCQGLSFLGGILLLHVSMCFCKITLFMKLFIFERHIEVMFNLLYILSCFDFTKFKNSIFFFK